MQTMMFSWGMLVYDTFKVLLLRPIILINNIDIGVKLAYHNYISIKMGPKIDYGRRQDIGPTNHAGVRECISSSTLTP